MQQEKKKDLFSSGFSGNQVAMMVALHDSQSRCIPSAIMVSTPRWIDDRMDQHGGVLRLRRLSGASGDWRRCDGWIGWDGIGMGMGMGMGACHVWLQSRYSVGQVT